MEGSAEFLKQLSDALDKRAKWLQSVQLPRLRDAFTAYSTLFESAMVMLIRKGLLREDPYNYDQSVTDIIMPSDTPLPDFESADEVSYRLAGFRRQLKFLTTEQEYSLGALKLPKLKKISALFGYINWNEFGDSSSSPTTRAFARAFMKVRMGSDTLASQILKDAEVQIDKVFHDVRAIIADLVAFHREAWKADVRRAALPHVPPEHIGGGARREEALRALRKAFGQEMDGRPWYPALAQEVVAEEMESDSANRKQALLSSLVIPETPSVERKKPQAVSGTTILLEAIRILCRPHEELVTAIESLVETEHLLETKETGFAAFLKRLFGSGHNPADDHTYKVQYMEPTIAVTKTETINFPEFADDVHKKATLMAALAAGSGPAYHRLERTNEQQLMGFLDKQLNELLLIHRRLTSFNTLFQARAVKNSKTGVRGIKLELLTLRNAIVKANRRRHDYTGRAEESGARPPSAAARAREESPA